MLNVGVVGPAGSGKTTVSRILTTSWPYRKQALAVPLKVTLAFAVHEQLDLPILGQPAYESALAVKRIVHGKMGYVLDYTGAFTDKFFPNFYAWDVRVRDFLIAFTDTHKSEFRGAMQQYGTEVIRHIAAKLGLAVPESANEPWLTALGNETRSNAIQGDAYHRSYATTCDDIRHIFEADYFVTEHNALLIKTLSSRQRGDGQTATITQHSSEHFFDRIPTHLLIRNDGDSLDDLAACVAAALAYAASCTPLPPRRLAADFTTPLFSRPGLTLFA